MQSANLIFPMFALVLLTLGVLIATGVKRKNAVVSGRVDAKFYKLFRDGEEPEDIRVYQRNFQNLIETPVLFYTACLGALAIGVNSGWFLALCWIYVALRYAHSYVHLGNNRVVTRFKVYLASLIALLAIWLSLGFFALGY